MQENPGKKQYELNIAGEKLNVVSADDKEYAEKLAKELTRRINGFLLSSANIKKNEAVLICALDLLDENVRLKALLEDDKKAAK